MRKWDKQFKMVTDTAWLERLHVLAGRRQHSRYVRDLVNAVYVDKKLRDAVNEKMEVMREK